MRTGSYVQQPTGYRAFLPAPLPPNPPVKLDKEAARLLSDADRALGRLDGVASILPNPDLFVAMYVRHEALLSSQIEGTQSSLDEVLQFETGERGRLAAPKDVEEVVNYVSAMNHGLRRLPELPLSLRLLREIHAELLKGVRGGERSPGEFRTSQNWVGPHGATLNNAQYVPPPPHEMREALDNLEKFLYDRTSLPVLLHCGVAHAQFETIHPFLDGNGRVGRLLITLLLCERGILRQPLLYLSYYLKAYRAQYYDRLMAIRHDGDWEGWLKFFLRGVFEVSQAATDVSRAIVRLREEHRDHVSRRMPSAVNGLRLLDYLFQYPMVHVRKAEEHLGCSFATANALIDQMRDLGIVREVTGRRRNRVFRYDAYLDLFEKQALALPSAESTQIE